MRSSSPEARSSSPPGPEITGEGPYAVRDRGGRGPGSDGRRCDVPDRRGAGFFATRDSSVAFLRVAARLSGDAAPSGMYINAGTPTRSNRAAPLDDGGTLAIVSGEGHRVGQGVEHGGATRCSTASCESTLTWGRPSIGGRPRTCTAWTACPSWDALRRPGPLRRHGLRRVGHDERHRRGAGDRERDPGIPPGVGGSVRARPPDPPCLCHGLRARDVNIAVQEVAGALRGTDGSPSDLRTGDAAVVEIDGSAVAATGISSGTLHSVSATCTHMGCTVSWNPAEASWDCLCHGSRFAPDGGVLHGPLCERSSLFRPRSCGRCSGRLSSPGC